MHREIKLKIVALAYVTLLGGCPSQSHFPAGIAAPAAATEVKATGSIDRSLFETSFSVQVERDSYSVANYLESQLVEAGYRSCSARSGLWETLRHRLGDQVVQEVRLLRFYEGSKRTQLGAILVTQTCDRTKPECLQRFLVRQIDVDKSQVDETYIQKICAQ